MSQRLYVRLLGVATSLVLSFPAWAEGEVSADGMSVADAKEAPEAETPKGEDHGVPNLIATGKRVTVKDGDFSLTPPRGWEVYTDLQGLTLLMQIPFQPGMKYQRTVQVASFGGPRFIDDVTAREFEDLIVRKFSATSAAVENYKIRNHMVIEMADGRQGLLFYSEFGLQGVDLMQAHILVSSKDRHYLMTYTDVAAHFESEAASQFLTEAWDAMISVELGSDTPTRFGTVTRMGVGFATLSFLAILILAFRRWRSGHLYRDGSQDPVHVSGTKSMTGSLIRTSDMQPLSGFSSDISGMSKLSKHEGDKHDLAS